MKAKYNEIKEGHQVVFREPKAYGQDIVHTVAKRTAFAVGSIPVAGFRLKGRDGKTRYATEREIRLASRKEREVTP